MMNARRCILLLAIASSLVLAGCAIHQPPFGADIMPESARAKIPGSWAGPHRSGEVVPGWIRNFGDPELNALVADAVERNPDLKAAAARVEASRAAVRVAASSLYPRIAMKGLGERQGQQLSGDLGRNINPPSFGGPGTEDSGGSGLDTSMDSSSQRWVYGLAAGAAWEADVAQETLDIYQEYSKLTDVRKQQGFASDFDVSQITSRNAAAEDALYAAQAARAQTIRAIEVVTSRYPAGKFDVRRSFPGQPRSVPVGLPAQILERRPDLIASERRFAAAFHRVNEARTARLPRFVLSATSGLGTADLDGVGALDALVWSFAGGVTQPIFFGGELKAAQDLRTAEQKAAAAAYVGHALRAFQEVEDALAGDYYLRKREGALGTVVSSSAESVTFSRQQLEQGQIDMFTVLRLAGENLAAKVQYTQIRASRLRERVNLYLALGGDFEGTGAPAK